MTKTGTYPTFPARLPESIEGSGRYALRWARSTAELEAVQRLRFEVFNLELQEGLDESYATGLDQDRFDPFCHHLMVVETATGAVVGTYRIQTEEMSGFTRGFYSAGEFDIAGLPAAVRANAIEIGRASVALEHRNQKALFLLWRGLASYMVKNEKRYLFGCCSLTSQEPELGKWVMDHLMDKGLCHKDYAVNPQIDWACYAEGFDPGPPDREIKLPKLFRTYMRYGAKVCGPPALDRFFKTIDYLVLLDTQELDRISRALFFRE